MIRTIEYTIIFMYLKEVALRAGHEVLMNVNDNSALIVGDPHKILGQQLRQLRCVGANTYDSKL